VGCGTKRLSFRSSPAHRSERGGLPRFEPGFQEYAWSDKTSYRGPQDIGFCFSRRTNLIPALTAAERKRCRPLLLMARSGVPARSGRRCLKHETGFDERMMGALPSELSGGATANGRHRSRDASQPKAIVCMMEPTSALDRHVQHINGTAEGGSVQDGRALVVVTHDAASLDLPTHRQNGGRSGSNKS